MKVRGHAGDVVVCAACSMLVQVAAAEIAENIGTIWKREAGVFDLECEDTEKARMVFKLALHGFQMLEKQYPKNVRVKGENFMNS